MHLELQGRRTTERTSSTIIAWQAKKVAIGNFWASGAGAESWTFGQEAAAAGSFEKELKSRKTTTCGRSEGWTATELVGAVLFGCLSSALEITAAVPRWWRERTYENYRTPTARDNPSIREEGGGGRRAGWCLGLLFCRRCLVMAEMGGTLNSCSCLWRRWGPILNNIQTNLDLKQYLDQPCIGRDLGDGLLQGSLRQSEAPGGQAFYLCLQWNLICIFARQLGPRGWIWCETWARDTGDKAKYRKTKQ